jgi:hypothetical protein
VRPQADKFVVAHDCERAGLDARRTTLLFFLLFFVLAREAQPEP